MRLFYVTEPVEAAVAYDRRAKRFQAALDGAAPADGSVPPARMRLLPPADAMPKVAEMYFATGLEWNPLACALAGAGRASALRLLSPAATARVMETPGLPPRLGYVHALGEAFVPIERQLERLPAEGAPRIAVVNFLHHAYGDAVVSLTVLRELRLRLERRWGDGVRIELFQNEYVAGVDDLYRRSGLVDAIHPLPAPLSALAACDAYFDFSLDAYDLDRHWTDALLQMVGIDPATVPAARKRNRLVLDEEAVRDVAPAVERARARGEPVLLFHPSASTPIRTCPPERAATLMREILERTPWTIACATPPALEHPRVEDWSGASRTFDHFLALIAAADAFVSADTCIHYAADAFSTPGVVFFTTLVPESRIRDYPYVDALTPGPGNPLAGLHDSVDPAHAAHARALWEQLDTDCLLDALHGVMRRKEAESPALVGAG
ncbi:MAG TPA: hypothetical protein VFR81_00910 [Longimicrobium sp.]|nr:hypothetical protein [Longimicrobium sp.]